MNIAISSVLLTLQNEQFDTQSDKSGINQGRTNRERNGVELSPN